MILFLLLTNLTKNKFTFNNKQMKGFIRMLAVNLAVLMQSGETSEFKKQEASKMNKMAGGLLFSQSPIPAKRLSQKKRRKLYRQSRSPKYK